MTATAQKQKIIISEMEKMIDITQEKDAYTLLEKPISIDKILFLFSINVFETFTAST